MKRFLTEFISLNELYYRSQDSALLIRLANEALINEHYRVNEVTRI